MCSRSQHTFVTHPWIVRDIETEGRMMINNQQVEEIAINIVDIHHIQKQSWN